MTMVDPDTQPVTPPADRAWDSHGELVRRMRGAKGTPSDSAAFFAQNAFFTGHLPEELTRRTVEVLAKSEPVQFRRENTLAEFRTNVHIVDEAQYGRENEHLMLGAGERRVLHAIVRHLRSQVQDCLGTPWRVVTVRSFRTNPPPGGNSPAPQEWHYDGFPADVLKIMVYLSDVGGDLGTTELITHDGSSKTVEGPAGTWLLFRNSVLAHRAVQPAKGTRLLAEITLAPALVSSGRIVVAGTNAQYQHNPYTMYWPVNLLARWGRWAGDSLSCVGAFIGRPFHPMLLSYFPPVRGRWVFENPDQGQLLDDETDRLLVGGELRFRRGGRVEVSMELRDRDGRPEARSVEASYVMIDDDTLAISLAPDRKEIFQLENPGRMTRSAVIGGHKVWEESVVANRQP